MSWFMVDIEADGPIPGDYSMVCFGAVLVEPALDRTFYGRLKPISDRWDPEALAVSGFTREETLTFDDPQGVMERFRDWLAQHSTGQPMFIADNNGFDWQFVNQEEAQEGIAHVLGGQGGALVEEDALADGEAVGEAVLGEEAVLPGRDLLGEEGHQGVRLRGGLEGDEGLVDVAGGDDADGVEGGGRVQGEPAPGREVDEGLGLGGGEGRGQEEAEELHRSYSRRPSGE